MEWLSATEANLLAVDIAKPRERGMAKGVTRKVALRPSEDSYLSHVKLTQSPEDFKASSRERSECVSCGGYFMYFCYKCRLPLPQKRVPHCTLPLRVDILKHVKELDSKSTGVHAKIIAPESVTIYDLPRDQPPDYSQLEDVVLVYPDPQATSTAHAAFPHRFRSTTRAVFIDATWKQARQILRLPAVASLPRIALGDGAKTLFWRYQTGHQDSSLATIEAIYMFTRDFHLRVLRREYEGNYDNLLFFFKMLHSMVQQVYT